MSGRGVAYWSGGADDKRVFVVTPGFFSGRSMRPRACRSASSARPASSICAAACADRRSTIEAGSSSPAIVVGDVVIVGPARRRRRAACSSKTNVKLDVRGFDVRTGKLLWTFHTIPEKGELGYETWLDGLGRVHGQRRRLGADVGRSRARLVYLPVEGADRATSTAASAPATTCSRTASCALDAKTGQRRLAPAADPSRHLGLRQPDVADPARHESVDGKPIKAVVQLTKQAFAYAFDRTNGKPVWPIEERPVPKSDVPGEWTSPTQPFPTKPPAFDRQGVTDDDLIDFTPEINAAALEGDRRIFRMGPMFTPSVARSTRPTARAARSCCRASAAARTGRAARSIPRPGMLYVGVADDAQRVRGATPRADRSDIRYLFVNGDAPHPLGAAAVKPPYGRITAIDMNKGEHRWMIPNGDTPKDIEEQSGARGRHASADRQAEQGARARHEDAAVRGRGLGRRAGAARATTRATGEVVAELPLPGVASACR